VMEWWRSSSTGSAPLTRETLERAIEAAREGMDNPRVSASILRAQAMAELDLDYAAMTTGERFHVQFCQMMDVIHPRDYERLKVIVEKYRRDR
jgi:hypothetical protein